MLKDSPLFKQTIMKLTVVLKLSEKARKLFNVPDSLPLQIDVYSKEYANLSVGETNVIISDLSIKGDRIEFFMLDTSGELLRFKNGEVDQAEAQNIQYALAMEWFKQRNV